MKNQLYILIAFMLLSGTAFGQDTLKIKSHIEGVVLPPVTGKPGKVNKDLVLVRKHTTYVLSQQEKDSVWNSIYNNAITQNLLKEDPQIKSKKWVFARVYSKPARRAECGHA